MSGEWGDWGVGSWERAAEKGNEKVDDADGDAGSDAEGRGEDADVVAVNGDGGIAVGIVAPEKDAAKVGVINDAAAVREDAASLAMDESAAGATDDSGNAADERDGTASGEDVANSLSHEWRSCLFMKSFQC